MFPLVVLVGLPQQWTRQSSNRTKQHRNKGCTTSLPDHPAEQFLCFVLNCCDHCVSSPAAQTGSDHQAEHHAADTLDLILQPRAASPVLCSFFSLQLLSPGFDGSFFFYYLLFEMLYTTRWKFSARTRFNMPRLQLCPPPQHTHTPVSLKQMQTADGTDVVITVLCVCVVLCCAGGDSVGITCQLEGKQATPRVEVSKVSGGEESACVCVCNIFYCEATVSQQ